MRNSFGALVFLALMSFSGAARASGETSLTTTVWSEDRLWMLSAAGQIFSIADKDDTPRLEYAGDMALGICTADGSLHAFVETDDYPANWQLRHREDGKWVDDLTLPSTSENYQDKAKIDKFITLACDDGGVSVVTEKRLYRIEKGKLETLSLKGKVGGNVAVALTTPQYLYLGYNHGEWGGGLKSIDRKSGKVKVIENKSGLCEGLLNTDCDPVNGLVVSPWKPDCVIAAIGLIHMSPHGRIVEVCGETIRRVYFKNYSGPDVFGDVLDAPTDPTFEAFETVAFYNLAVKKDIVVAIGMDGVYRLHADGQVDFEALPEFRDVPPFSVNFDDPDLAMVLTSFNSRHAVGWMTPMLSPRD